MHAQMFKDFLDDFRVFNRRDDPDRPTALFTFLYVSGEHALEPLRPRHRVGLRFLTLLFFYWFLWNDILAQFTVEREHPVKASQVHPRLAALVPGPGVNLTRFHGVFSPNSKLREHAVPAKPVEQEESQKPGTYAMTWAQRLKRVLAIDIEKCEKCGGPVRIVASIEERNVAPPTSSRRSWNTWDRLAQPFAAGRSLCTRVKGQGKN
jgi:hypothetical protein